MGNEAHIQPVTKDNRIESAADWRDDYDNESIDKRFTSAAYVHADFGKFVKLKVNLGIDFRNLNRYVWYGDATPPGQARNGYASVEDVAKGEASRKQDGSASFTGDDFIEAAMNRGFDR